MYILTYHVLQTSTRVLPCLHCHWVSQSPSSCAYLLFRSLCLCTIPLIGRHRSPLSLPSLIVVVNPLSHCHIGRVVYVIDREIDSPDCGSTNDQINPPAVVHCSSTRIICHIHWSALNRVSYTRDFRVEITLFFFSFFTGTLPKEIPLKWMIALS